MNKEKELKEIIKNLYEGFDSAALFSSNKDGSLKVVKEEQSSCSFIVYEENYHFEPLLDEFRKLNYLIDLKNYKGLIPGLDLIKVDGINKTVTRPLVVSINHYCYLREKESILLIDVINNFDEMVNKKNKSLIESLYQFNKNKKR